MEIIHLFNLALWSDYTFQIVLAGTTILGILCGILGSFIVLRREALLGDGIAHSAYPGIMLAFMFMGVKTLDGLLLGAFFSALIALSIILLAKQYTKLPFDGILAAILSSFFGAGLVLAAIIQHSGNANQSGLNQFIFGQASTILYRDVILTAGLSLLILIVVCVFWKELKLMAFDPDYARSLGFPGGKLNILLSFLTMTTVLLSIQAVGIIFKTVDPSLQSFNCTIHRSKTVDQTIRTNGYFISLYRCTFFSTGNHCKLYYFQNADRTGNCSYCFHFCYL